MNYPFEKIFKAVLKNGGTFADLYHESSRTHSIVCDDNKIEKVITGTDAGVGLRAISDFKTSYAYGNRCSEKDVLALAADLAGAVKGGSAGAVAKAYPLKPRVNLPVSLAPETIETAKKVAMVRKANAAARAIAPPCETGEGRLQRQTSTGRPGQLTRARGGGRSHVHIVCRSGGGR